MKGKDIVISGIYVVKVSEKLAPVRIDRACDRACGGGWDGTNLRTGKSVHIRGAGKIRGPWLWSASNPLF